MGLDGRGLRGVMVGCLYVMCSRLGNDWCTRGLSIGGGLGGRCVFEQSV